MSFLTIPQNYAPGFVPQRYLYLNDSAAGQLTAQLTDTRTGEEIASLALHNLWMPEIDVSAFLRRIAAPVPFETGATGLHLPEQRTLTLSMQIGADQAADRIYLPATAATEEGEPLTALPNVRLIGAGETDEISFNCHSQVSATLSVTTGSGRADKTYSETGTGVVLFHLNVHVELQIVHHAGGGHQADVPLKQAVECDLPSLPRNAVGPQPARLDHHQTQAVGTAAVQDGSRGGAALGD